MIVILPFFGFARANRARNIERRSDGSSSAGDRRIFARDVSRPDFRLADKKMRRQVAKTPREDQEARPKNPFLFLAILASWR
jgi:hypothetical protein